MEPSWATGALSQMLTSFISDCFANQASFEEPHHIGVMTVLFSTAFFLWHRLERRTSVTFLNTVSLLRTCDSQAYYLPTHCDHHGVRRRQDSLAVDRGSNEKDGITDVFWLVEKIKVQLSEFAELRERIRANIESMVNLVPSLEEEKRNLQNALVDEREKIIQMEDLIPKLESQKEDLQDEIERKQGRMSRIDDQLRLLSRAKTRKA